MLQNINNQYLTIGTPTITDFRTTEQWKQVNNWALKNGYKQGDLDKMNANEIKDLLLKYNPSPKPPVPPTPHNNGLSPWAWFGIILGSGLFLVGVPYCFYAFVIRRRIRKKRWEKFNNIRKDNDKNKESESE